MFFNPRNLYPNTLAIPVTGSGSIARRVENRANEIHNILALYSHPSTSHIENLKEELQMAKDGESWASAVIRALLYNLDYDGSRNGHYGTPDQDIIGILRDHIPYQKVWIRILGEKLEVLSIIIQRNKHISSIHRERIEKIVYILRTEIYKNPKVTYPNLTRTK